MAPLERVQRLFRSRPLTYLVATLFVCFSGALGNAAWRQGWLAQSVPLDSAFLVGGALIAAVALTIWRPKDFLLVWLVFLPVALVLGFYAVILTAVGIYGDSL